MFYQGWWALVRVAITGGLLYLYVVALLRITGKRSLARLNAFDFIVTVALGSMMASTVLNQEISLLEGFVGFAVLVGMQFAVAYLQLRSPAVAKMVKSQPRLLLYRGQPLRDVMRRERVLEAEIRQALRSEGLAGLDEATAVVLETDGTLSVLRQVETGDDSALADVARPDGGLEESSPHE